MADDNANQDTGGEPKLLAGKYADAAALETGVKELMGKLGYPELDADAKIIGGLVPDEAKAEAFYKRLESEFGKRQSAKPKGDEPLAIKKPKPEDEPANIGDFLASRGIDADEVVTEFKKNGKLTPEQYTKFGNLPRALVNDYLQNLSLAGEALKMRRERSVGEAVKIAGDEQKLGTYRTWAMANMEESRLSTLNAILEKNVDFYPEYIRIIKNEYEAKVGPTGGKTVTNGTASASTSPVNTREELSVVMAGVSRGDPAAIARLAKTSDSIISKLSSQ